MVVTLVGDEVGVGIFHFHAPHMDDAMHNIFHDGPHPELLHEEQIVALQVFYQEMVEVDGEVGGDIEPSDLHVGSGDGGYVTSCNSDSKLLDDGILNAHKDTHDERKYHHK